MNKCIGLMSLLLSAMAASGHQTDSTLTVKPLGTDSVKTVDLGSVSVIARQKNQAQHLVHFFRANEAATLEDILGRLPEITMTRRGPYGMEPAIRAFSDGQINVLVDGMRMHGACTDKMDPVTIYIEPVNLENLQLQTGDAGQLKGASIGGTVDMKLAGPAFGGEKRWKGSLQSGYQSVSRGLYEAGTLQYSGDRWAFRASGTYRQHQNYADGNGNEVLYSQFRKANLSLSAKYKLSASSHLKADFIADEGRDIGYPALPMDVGFARAGIASLAMITENRQRRLYRWEAKLYANRVEHEMDDTQRPDVPMPMDMPGYSATVGAFAEGSVQLNRRQQLQVRADASSTFLQASMTMYAPGENPMYMLTWPDNRRQQTGVSLSWQMPLDSTTRLRVSARSDLISGSLTTQEAKDQVAIVSDAPTDRVDFLQSLTVHMAKKIGRALEATASLGYSSRMPTASELYGFYLFNARDGYDYIGQADLHTEKALQAETSLGWQQRDLKFKITAFGSWLDDYIMGIVDPAYQVMTIGAKGVKLYQNTGRATLAGFEGSIQWKFASNLALVSTIRYTYAADENQHPLPFIAPFKNIGSLRYARNRFSLQAECEWALAQHRINAASGEQQTPGYLLAHARAGYTLPWLANSLSLQAGVENLFDAAYREHLDWGTVLRPGRNVYAQLKWVF